jgi:hypothetical protein
MPERIAEGNSAGQQLYGRDRGTAQKLLLQKK